VRIVGLINLGPANAQYRVALPLSAMAGRGHQTEVHLWTPDLPERLLSLLRSADAVLMWRLYMRAERRLATALRDAGVAIVWDNDDDMVGVRPQVNTNATVAREVAHRELSQMMRLADAVTTTSGELARRFRKMANGEVKVIDNYVAPESLRAPRGAGGADVTIGWVAGAEHRADLKRLGLRSALERVLRRHAHVRVVSVGVDLGLRHERYTWQPGVAFADLPSFVAQFDVGIAPIADVSFNRARSSVKVKEYAAAGVPWLASPIGPYAGLGEQQGGRLVPDPLWERRLEELVEDAGARGELAQRASAWARTQTVVAHADEWEETFERAVERARARSGETVGASAAGQAARAAAGAGPAAEGASADGDGSPRAGFFARLGRRDRARR
jgi:glycosyltransferase involved in cell wall biosynthesis